jgi:hypothetical protein
MCFVAAWLTLGAITPAPAQDPESPTERIKSLADPEKALDAKIEREKQRPPFEFFRSQIAPFEVLPYIKPNHWTWFVLEARANLADYDGVVRTSVDVAGKPQIKLAGMSHAIVYARDARMAKGQTMRLGMPLMLPIISKELVFELARPNALRPDGGWQSSLLPLSAHQMLVPILAADSNLYSTWINASVSNPGLATAETATAELERLRYYKFVAPQTPGKPPPVAGHPLAWTTTSHVIWDGLIPDSLDLAQQQAMLDWLHWGGQLIVIASGPGVALLNDSFLSPYLPATLTGENSNLSTDELKALADQYRPPLAIDRQYADINVVDFSGRATDPPTRYRAPEPINATDRQPIPLAALEPKPGATKIPLSPDSPKSIAVEWRVGRGRVLMLAIRPTEPALRAWPGRDTFVRTLLFRRREEPRFQDRGLWSYGLLDGSDLSWTRYVARDLDLKPWEDPNASPNAPGFDTNIPTTQVAAWTDTAAIPDAARRTLEKASGITIPGSGFVLKVVLAYCIALVPLNLLVCRFGFRRTELAWLIAPILAIAFAVIVERYAAYDIGFDRACDEIDVLEIQSDYDRAHLSRFAAIYSTGRDRYEITYPGDPSAVVLPLAALNSLRGEDVAVSSSQYLPEPGLADFMVQPRSLALFRSEAIVPIAGTVQLVGDQPESAKLINNSNLEFRRAVLIDTTNNREFELGTIPAGASIDIANPTPPTTATPDPKIDWADYDALLASLRTYRWTKPEDEGEWRLVALVDKPHPGDQIKPAVDRHRGFRLAIAHLRYGAPPNHTGQPYYSSNDPIPANPPPINADLIQEPRPEGDAENDAENPQPPASGVPPPQSPK